MASIHYQKKSQITLSRRRGIRAGVVLLIFMTFQGVVSAQVIENKLGIGIYPPKGTLHLHDAGASLLPINPNGGTSTNDISESDFEQIGSVILRMTNLNTGSSVNDGFMIHQENTNITLKQLEQGYVKLTTPGGSITLSAAGYFGIGAPQEGFRLNVATGHSRFGGDVNVIGRLFVGDGFVCDEVGNLKVKHIKVTLTGWADYVFDELYNLMPIGELDDYIHTHHHLPGIPSESEVVNEGIDMGEMNRLLLEKVEELTLRVIDLQKQIDEMKNIKSN